MYILNNINKKMDNETYTNQITDTNKETVISDDIKVTEDINKRKIEKTYNGSDNEVNNIDEDTIEFDGIDEDSENKKIKISDFCDIGEHVYRGEVYLCEDCTMYGCRDCLFDDVWEKRFRDEVFLCLKCYKESCRLADIM